LDGLQVTSVPLKASAGHAAVLPLQVSG
jgi:hypothetical protein